MRTGGHTKHRADHIQLDHPGASAIFLLLCAVSACDCGGGKGAESALEAIPTTIDFGRVGVGLAGRKGLVLSNTGLAPVKILEMKVNEELAPELRMDSVPSGIAGAGMYTVPLVFSPKIPGDRAGTITIKTDSAATPEVVVRIVGEAVNPQLMVSVTAIDFGRVIVGTMRTATVSVTNSGTEEVTVRAVTGDVETTPEFRAALGSVRRLEPGESFTLALSYAPTDTSFDEGRMILVDDTDIPMRVSIGVRGEGAISELGLEPSAIDIRGIFPGETKQRFFDIKNLGTRDLEIARILLAGSSTISELSVVTSTETETPFTLRAGESRRVVVEYAPIDAGRDSAVVAIDSDALDGQAYVFLTGVASAIPFAALSALPGDLSFGSVELGSVRRKTLRLINHGTEDVRLQSIELLPASPEYRLVEAPEPGALFEPGEDRVVFVELSPFAAGPVAPAVIVVRTDQSPELNISLSGAGSADPVPHLEATLEPFGAVPFGLEVVRNLLIESTGTATAVIDSVTMLEGVFTLPEPVIGSIALAPGETLRVPVRFFDDGLAGPLYSASVELTSNDPDFVDELYATASTIDALSAPAELWVELSWTGGADVDLHVVRAEGRLFDRPTDATFCSPNPDWGVLFEMRDNPLYLRDAFRAPGSERVLSDRVFPGDYAVIVHHKDDGGFGAATIELIVRSLDRELLRSTRVIASGQRFDAGTFHFDGAEGSFAASLLPVSSLLRDDCY
jgi:hypothetical protein